MAAGQGRYYLELAREDYYLEGGEPPGLWWGKGAEALGLSGKVERRQLERLLLGEAPDGRPLVQNAGNRRRQPGWDLTFSAPKTVSVLWSQADEPTRRIIQAAHLGACRDALDYLQEAAGFSRRGRAGTVHEQAALVAASFEHGTSRALDPQLHSHFLVMNVAVRADGTTGTILSKPLYQEKMTAGALYRASLSYRLERELRIQCEAHRTWFEVVGVPAALVEFFSKRRAAIKERLSARGLESASAAAFAALETREAKDLVPPRAELFRRWREDAAEFGFDLRKALSTSSSRERTARLDPLRQVKRAIESITESESHFTESQVLRRAAELSQAPALSAAALREAVRNTLRDDKTLVSLGEHDRRMRYTTAEMMKAERSLFGTADRLRSRTRHAVPRQVVSDVVKRFKTPRSPIVEEVKHHVKQMVRAARGKPTERLDRKRLRDHAATVLAGEQITAVRHLTRRDGGSVRIVEGLAGTGKTAMLRAVREAWERAGYRVLGAALSGKAGQELQGGAGIESLTLRQLEWRMNPPLKSRLKHDATQLVRAARGRRTYRKQPLTIDKKTVLVVDEAGMVGTRQMEWLVRTVKKGGGLLILVGDRRQLQPIEAGAPFPALADRLGRSELVDIRRQKAAEDRALVKDAAEGKAKSVLNELARQGRLSVSPDRKAATEKLVSDWFENERGRRDKAFIFCGTNKEVEDINQRCQERRLQSGELRSQERIRVGDTTIHRGDRVFFRKTDRPVGVNNGDTGTVLSINSSRRIITVRLDSGRTVAIPRSYRDIALGYAMTTHKAQGATTHNAYILAGGMMQDRELSYVQLSRASDVTRVYTDVHEAGPDHARLAQQMATSRKKTLAHDVTRDQDSPRQIRQEQVQGF